MNFGTASVYELRQYISNDMAFYQEIGLRALGRIISSIKDDESITTAKMKYDAVQLFEQNLNHPDEQVRGAVVDALYRNSGSAGRRLVDGRMENEYSPVVLSAYEKVVEEFKDK